MRKKIAFVILSFALFSNCTVKKALVKNTERLDLAQIKSLVSKHLNGDRALKPVTKNDTLTHLFNYNALNGEFGILQKNLKTGIIISISGKSKYGYVKLIYNTDQPYLERKEYYETGRIRSIEKFYSEEYLEPNPKQIEFRIDTAYYYDAQGNVFEVDNYNDLYKYTYEDIKNKIKDQAPDGEVTQAESRKYQNGQIIWKIHYVSKKFGLSYLSIDATTGDILNHSHNIKTYE